MGAIFGIFGEADFKEVEKIGSQMAHRGIIGISWSLHDRMHFGMRIDAQIDDKLAPPDKPVAFDGLLELPKEISYASGFEKSIDSGSEVIFNLYRKLGAKGFRHLKLPFAIALWDDSVDSLILAADPLGVKAFYYTIDKIGRLIFASEYKAILAIDTVRAAPDLDALQYVHRTKYAMPGRTCLNDVKSIPRGAWLEISKSGIVVNRYQDISVNIVHRSEQEHTKFIQESLLRSAEKVVSRSDKIGVALSGGVDSVAAVAAICKAAPNKTIQTFTTGVSINDQALLEAQKIAETLKTVHHEQILNVKELPTLICNTLWHMEEPTGREERIMYYVTAVQASKHVNIVVTGHNSDTIFGGMPRHMVASIAFRMPVIRRPLAEFYNFTQTGEPPESILAKAIAIAYLKGEIPPASKVVGAQWNPPKKELLSNSKQPLNDYLKSGEFNGASNTYANEKIFDGAGVEIISLFWDLDLIKDAFQIPDRLKINWLRQKYILKKALFGLLPEHLLDRKKDFTRIFNNIEFCDCIDEIAKIILLDDIITARGLFEASYVSKIKTRPRSGFYKMQQFYDLWTLILIELWCKIFIDNRGQKKFLF